MRAWLVFLLVFSLSFAAYESVKTLESPSEPGEFDTGTPAPIDSFAFRSLFRFDPQINVRATDPDRVLVGDPNNLRSGDVICPNSEVEVSADLNSVWGGPALEGTIAFYPRCLSEDPADCPLPDPYFNTPRVSIKWLTSIDRYKDLYPNSVASVSYDNELGGVFSFTPFSGRYYLDGSYKNVGGRDARGVTIPSRVRGQVFCEGKVRFRKDGSLMASIDAGNVARGAYVTTTMDEGTKLFPSSSGRLSVSLEDVDCFAVTVDEPGQQYIAFYYPEPGAFSGVSKRATEDVVSLRVEDAVCSFSSTLVTAELSRADVPNAYSTIRVRNDGNVPIRVVGVESLNPDFTVSPATSFCIFPGSCPSNGFNEDVAPGETKELEVWITGDRDPGDTDFIRVRLRAQTSTPDCSGKTLSCTDEVSAWSPSFTPCLPGFDPDCPAPGGEVGCFILPSSASVQPNQKADFLVRCFRRTGGLGDSLMFVPCSGVWAIADLETVLFDPEGELLTIASNSPPGTTGRVIFTLRDGTSCDASVEITAPEGGGAECVFDPSSATLAVGEGRRFNLNCAVDGVPTVPNEVSYSISGGLVGTLSDEDKYGVVFTGAAPSEGYLNAEATLSLPGGGVIVIVPSPARIVVEDRGARPDVYCEFDPPSATVPIGSGQRFDLNCFVRGSPATPSSVTYSLDNPIGLLASDDETGVTFLSLGLGTALISADVELMVDGAPQPARAVAEVLVVDCTPGVDCPEPPCERVDCPGGPGGGRGGEGGADSGRSEFCVLAGGRGPLLAYSGMPLFISLGCGSDGSLACSSAEWTVSPGLTVSGSGRDGIEVIPTSPGTYTVTASVSYSAGSETTSGTCSIAINAEEPLCPVYS